MKEPLDVCSSFNHFVFCEMRAGTFLVTYEDVVLGWLKRMTEWKKCQRTPFKIDYQFQEKAGRSKRRGKKDIENFNQVRVRVLGVIKSVSQRKPGRTFTLNYILNTPTCEFNLNSPAVCYRYREEYKIKLWKYFYPNYIFEGITTVSSASFCHLFFS